MSCKRKEANNVIAKERSDCGNLNSHNAKNVYFLRSAVVELVLDVSSLALEFTLGCTYLFFCRGSGATISNSQF
ncbi:MAG: hypothetical protein FVQ84_05125 [Planctomycetes bacterium]|nr:hypothetical protein [Planctomycetota bacterium]